MATPRKSYTLQFKRDVLATLDNLNGNVSATANQHKLTRRHVQRWRDDRTNIMSCGTPPNKKQPGGAHQTC